MTVTRYVPGARPRRSTVAVRLVLWRRIRMLVRPMRTVARPRRWPRGRRMRSGNTRRLTHARDEALFWGVAGTVGLGTGLLVVVGGVVVESVDVAGVCGGEGCWVVAGWVTGARPGGGVAAPNPPAVTLTGIA